MVLTWEDLWRFLWCWSSFCCCYSSFVVVFLIFFFFFFHSHFLFNIIPQTSVDYSQVFRPILHFHFHFSTIPLSSDHKRYGFEWTFFTHRRFLPYAPSRHFWHSLHFGTTCFYQGFTGSWQLLFESCRVHTVSQNTHPAHLFDSQ